MYDGAVIGNLLVFVTLFHSLRQRRQIKVKSGERTQKKKSYAQSTILLVYGHRSYGQLFGLLIYQLSVYYYSQLGDSFVVVVAKPRSEQGISCVQLSNNVLVSACVRVCMCMRERERQERASEKEKNK